MASERTFSSSMPGESRESRRPGSLKDHIDACVAIGCPAKAFRGLYVIDRGLSGVTVGLEHLENLRTRLIARVLGVFDGIGLTEARLPRALEKRPLPCPICESSSQVYGERYEGGIGG